MADEEIIELEEVFGLFDKDGDGDITLKELGSVMRLLGLQLTAEELQEMINVVNAASNNGISFQVFRNLVMRKLKDEAELRQVLANLGENLTDEEFEDIMREVDEDDDDDEQFNYEKFVNMMWKK